MIKRIIFSWIMFLSTPAKVLANGHHEEEAGIGAQLNELLPFEHFGESHWLAFILSLVLWGSLIYTVFVLIRKFMAK